VCVCDSVRIGKLFEHSCTPPLLPSSHYPPYPSSLLSAFLPHQTKTQMRGSWSKSWGLPPTTTIHTPPHLVSQLPGLKRERVLVPEPPGSDPLGIVQVGEGVLVLVRVDAAAREGGKGKGEEKE
jgi:hypothetical protein